MSLPLPRRDPGPQPLWYKDAVAYQLHVKTFADSNGVRSLFPRMGELPYALTLGPYVFFWFRLRRF